MSLNGSARSGMNIITTTSQADRFFNSSKENNSICFSDYDKSIATFIIQTVLGLLIIALNGVVIFLIYKNLRRNIFRKPAFVFISALSLSDILLATSIICLTIILIGDFQFSASSWVAITGVTSILFNTSVNLLLVIAIDRLLFIAYNTRYVRIMSRRNVIGLVLLSFIIGAFPVTFLAGSEGSCANLCICRKNKNIQCPHPSCSTVLVGMKKEYLFGLVFYFFVMLFSISTVYSILFWKVHKQGQKVVASSEQATRRMIREKQLAHTLVLVVMVLAICWTPLMILYAVEYSTTNFDLDFNIIQIFLMPTILNSLFNPIVYASRVPMLKKHLCPCCMDQNSKALCETPTMRRSTHMSSKRRSKVAEYRTTRDFSAVTKDFTKEENEPSGNPSNAYTIDEENNMVVVKEKKEIKN